MLPTAGVNRVFGLLDLLKAYNGKTDNATLTFDLPIDLDQRRPIIASAESLRHGTAKDGEISPTELGTEPLHNRIAGRHNPLNQPVETRAP